MRSISNIAKPVPAGLQYYFKYSGMAMSFDALRVGKKYYLTNFGERFEFLIQERKDDRNFLVKDLHTLEHYELKDLVRYGIGKDFELYELD